MSVCDLSSGSCNVSGTAVWPGGINELKVSTEGLILERMGSDKG